MPTAAQSIAPDLVHLPIAVNLRGISLAEGLRAGLSVAVIIAASEFIDFPPLREAGLAALLTCICDPGGPIRRRVPVLLSFMLVGAAVTAGFGLVREISPWIALPLGIFGLFCSSFARIYGQAPQQLGGLLATVQILSLDRGIPDPTGAGILALAFIGGSLWAILLTLVLWRIHPFLPARRAVADIYRRLSDLVRDLHGLAGTAGISDTDWEAHARVHRGATRNAIEAARTVVMDTVRSRGAASNRAAQLVIRLETADQIFGGLIALSDLLEHGTSLERDVARRVLRRMQPLLRLLGRVIVTDEPNTHIRIDRAIDLIVGELAAAQDDDPLIAVMTVITERLRIAHTLAVPTNIQPGADHKGQGLPLRDQVFGPLRSNLVWKSPALRHALRTAVTAAGPLAYTMIWFNPYDHWLTITVVATMQPYFSLTFTRAIERIVGTAAGGVLAAAVGLLCTTPLTMAVAMFPLAVAALAVRAVTLSLFMLAMTPLVVLLVETGSPGMGEWEIAAYRAAFTIIGGMLAVAANFLLWPSREPDLVAAEAKKAIAAHADFAEADFAALLGEKSPVEQTRRAAGVASNALEALITRALLEPGRDKQVPLEAAMVIDAALRRCAGRLATMQHGAEQVPQETLRRWRDWIARSLHGLAEGRTDLTPRPAGPASATLTRIARQIELMSGAAARLQ